MKQLRLNQIEKQENTVIYHYSVSEELKHFFSSRLFIIEYPLSLETVPDAVLAVPFVANVLPIVWLTDSELVIPELDKAFYDCIPNVKAGYETMFPESSFLGKVTVGNVVPCENPSKDRCALFYSGGVDSMQTLISHVEEHPILLSVWGSDIRYDNQDGWNVMHKAIEEAASHYHLDEYVIRSTFREFDDEGALDRQFSAQLKDGWWHGAKHGLALLGHVAPIAWLLGLNRMYIASSHCPQDGHVRCASNPLTDDHVRFANCQVCHDGFAFSRQDKIKNIVQYNKGKVTVLPLHVCWETQTGSNCSKCEKCYRTMCAIAAENTDCSVYGFEKLESDKHFHYNLVHALIGKNEVSTSYWTHIKKRIIDNEDLLKKQPYWAKLRLLKKIDFAHPEKLKMPFYWRVRTKLPQMRWYRALSKVKHYIIDR